MGLTMERIDVLTVHYNTPEMMECMIRSLNKHTVCRIHVFDNSDEYPFENKFENVEVIDNTRGQIINFDKWLQQYPDRKARLSNFGSPKHCKTIDLCFEMFPKGFILMDSDVLVKKDITPFWDKSVAWVGEPHVDQPKGLRIRRVLPFLCFLNVPVLRQAGVRYFNPNWMWHLLDVVPNKWYDTGAWFYKDCARKELLHRDVSLEPYIEHFFHGSHAVYNDGMAGWLKKHKDLWL